MPHELGPVAGIDELPEPELALIFVRDPGIMAHILAVEQLQQLIPAQKGAQLGHRGLVRHGDIEFRLGLFPGDQHIIIRLFLAKAHPLDAGDSADAVDAVEHKLSGLIHKNPSKI